METPHCACVCLPSPWRAEKSCVRSWKNYVDEQSKWLIYSILTTSADFDCVSVLSEHFDVCCLAVCDKQPIDAVLLYIWRMWSWCLVSISICVGRTPVATDPTVDGHSWCSETEHEQIKILNECRWSKLHLDKVFSSVSGTFMCQGLILLLLLLF